LKKKIFRETDILIANTPSMLNAYSAHYPELKNKIKLIPNGFDEADFTGKKQKLPNEKMTLLHCGRFGASGRDPSILFHGLKKLKEQGCRIALHLLGEDNPSITELVKSLELQSIVRITGPTPHDKAINTMYDADVLVVYQNESQKTEISAIAGKTYEYLRIGKPILAIAPPGDNLNIIKQYALRHETVSNYSVEEINKAISNLYVEWRQGSLNSGSIINEDFISCYNRHFLSKKLAETFNSLT
jgi:glycosyltransferase involved in cell wall biosynthesis